jgi:hypothetical protein
LRIYNVFVFTVFTYFFRLQLVCFREKYAPVRTGDEVVMSRIFYTKLGPNNLVNLRNAWLRHMLRLKSLIEVPLLTRHLKNTPQSAARSLTTHSPKHLLPVRANHLVCTSTTLSLRPARASPYASYHHCSRSSAMSATGGSTETDNLTEGCHLVLLLQCFNSKTFE